MPVIIGVLLAIISLVVFSEWFYHTALGWHEVVLDDSYFKYRVLGATLFSLFVIGSTVIVMAYTTECKNDDREGVLARLNCEEYQKITTAFEQGPIDAER